jgi:hypothetical protein
MRVTGLVAGSESQDGCSKNTLAALNIRLRRPAINVLITGDAKKDASPAAFAIFHQALQLVVNKWIDSGKRDGKERPYRRVPPRDVLLEYTERNPAVWDIFAPDGELRLQVVPVSFFEKSDQKRAAYDAAVALFIQLLDSPKRARLFRCDGCRTYFLRQRMPKKDTPIERGSYCENCKREGKDRIRRTEDSRGERTKQMIRWAADAWVQWKPKRQHGDEERAKWVTWKVNQQMITEGWDPLQKTNWVTRHTNKIQEEVDRRKQAKG